MTKMDLARTALRIERDILGENVGVQDHLHTAFGGVNRFDFDGTRFKVSPVQVRGETMAAIDCSLVLINTGIARRATNVAAEQRSLTKTSGLDKDLGELYAMVGEAVDVLESGSSDVLPELGRRLVESWKIKRQLTGNVTNDSIDSIYQIAMDVGAYGGKLCGAGGGGYIMMLLPPEQIPKLAERLQHLAVIPTSIDVAGTMVLSRGHNDQQQPLNTGPAILPGRSGGANDNNTVNAQDLSNLSLLRAYRPPTRAS
jgi:D-glycero-alpha-D-manno-heptose-7-phosphate kinase